MVKGPGLAQVAVVGDTTTMLKGGGTFVNELDKLVKAPGPVAVSIWPVVVHVPFTLASTLVAWVGGVVAKVLQVRVVVSVLGAVTAAGVWVKVNVVVPGV